MGTLLEIIFDIIIVIVVLILLIGAIVAVSALLNSVHLCLSERLFNYFQYAYRKGLEQEFFDKLISKSYDENYQLFKELRINKRIQQKCFKNKYEAILCYDSFLDAVNRTTNESLEIENALRDLKK